MAKAKHQFTYLEDGTLNISEWLNYIKSNDALKDISVLHKACLLAKELSQGKTTFYHKPCLEQGLEVAETILDLKLDQETAAAGIMACVTIINAAEEEHIKKELSETVAKLAFGVQQLEFISTLQKQKNRDEVHIDKIRKMLLAMAKDIRVVIIKLVECLCFMRSIKNIPADERKQYAQQVLDIYAPLANRLGIGQLKWELEDLAFRYHDPDTYKTIANYLAERRADREQRVLKLIHYLQDKLKASHIHADITGRAKHIYSIYLKMQRKQLDYQNIYDSTAVRILVPTIQDCYTALSIVHSVWSPIIEEFDDYIANPKPNGYRSIHTAVIGEDGKHFEIQIRTRDMHEEAERGVAAHWIYKEKAIQPATDASKMTYLRQLLDWHQEVASANTAQEKHYESLIEDQIYVMTPAGDILDLPMGATPLDFAYRIHSEIGHRCRGAKVNGQIVPLNYTLRTGDKVEIITILQGHPSRDWLNSELGYLKTTNAKSRVLHWFKQQAFNQDVSEGRQLLERELSRAGLSKTTSLQMLARHFNLKNEDALLAAVNRGNVKLAQIMHLIQPKTMDKPTAIGSPILQKSAQKYQGSAIAGGSDLLTRFAKCCKPIPGDDIIGYITQGRGISIHKRKCANVKQLSDPNRFMQINWDNKDTDVFSTDLKIIAEDQKKVLNDLTALFANEKINLINFHSNFSENHNKFFIALTIQIQNIEQLQRLLHRIQQLPHIIEVTRVK